jgi:hypothetical protein
MKDLDRSARTAPLVVIAATWLTASLSGCMIHSSSAPSAAVPRDESVVEVGAGSEDEGDLSAGMASSFPDGFLVKSTRTAVIEPDARRDPVAFESAWAEATFERALGERKNRGDAIRGRSNSGLPLLWTTEDRSVLSDNAFYNEQAKLADRDRDGQITDEEARAYAATSARVASR